MCHLVKKINKYINVKTKFNKILDEHQKSHVTASTCHVTEDWLKIKTDIRDVKSKLLPFIILREDSISFSIFALNVCTKCFSV